MSQSNPVISKQELNSELGHCAMDGSIEATSKKQIGKTSLEHQRPQKSEIAILIMTMRTPQNLQSRIRSPQVGWNL
ncbi:hypothetical protein JCM33374_g1049 [Metschnikowia sp. JCM 33374]|nr:hypothetical protein JCM33374_g1049 [Metschnikowia sp. JCM 33374]